MLFSSLLNTADVRTFICETLRDACPDTWAKQAVQTVGGCVAQLAHLPVTEGGLGMSDGKSQASTPRESPTARSNHTPICLPD